ncbi:RNA polymerase factor sigma-54 [Nitrosospira multiformis]|uniref:RNA polymerase sigma-54 factor n=1 Tax=Nitrosospira multiformis (strain ATCC 25196 / NCIMB 11849 / C 71) TaxID=323848 RepID=Q2YCX8_NITMU|nr:RNA polymerase factor sigma-54 [Nitrosospira multiformis]ABB73393.1 RNA polymerase, sigma 54 subunit, RpoN/SigL [Nitrosospira multiformis ATCC 25196]SEA69627.1 RNA polymerase, sigma 54 subunit, RpoN/SigL [Nitrosospira multiformis]SEG09706.1 RNA polymerase, sigma 54 subunit, RpoN/SigL [Nitrosospira multiformis ATCC 25196]
MKPTLQVKLSQHLALTPQLQQSIRLLQLSTIELNQEIERIVQENPLLELDDSLGNDSTDYHSLIPEELAAPLPNELEVAEESLPILSVEAETDVKQPLDEREWPPDDSVFRPYRDDEDERDIPQQAVEPPNLRAHLNSQLSLSQISQRDRKITGLLIDSLDDDGYLVQDLEELVDLLPAELSIDIDDLHIALEHLQHLDPPGIGARNLRECLVMQLQALPPDTPYLEQALALVNNHLESLASRDFGAIKRVLHCNDDCLRSVQQMITRLNPRPATAFSSTVACYIVPDVIVTKVGGSWVASLNPEAMPRLRINRLYAEILKGCNDDSTRRLISQLQEAKWLVKNVQQRFNTILKASAAIVERQQQFFEHGAVAMRPMILREIADVLNLHESTISRVTTQKFMRTPRGIFELKYFFGSHVSTDSGGACSATAIRALIKQMISEENSRKPLSDSQISEVLGQQGIMVARRTVAKYRESLQIPSVNLRKSF